MPRAEKVTPTDPLEKQLEMLFSDVAAPGLPDGDATASHSSLLPRFDPPVSPSPGRGQVLPPRHRSGFSRWWLGVLAILALLIVLLIEQENIAWLTTRTLSMASEARPSAGHPINQAEPTVHSTAAVMPFVASSTPVPVVSSTGGLQSTSDAVAVPVAGEKRESTPTAGPNPSPATPDNMEPTATTKTEAVATASEPTQKTPTPEPTPLPTLSAMVVPPPTLTPTSSPEMPTPTLSVFSALVIPVIDLEAPIIDVGYETQDIGGSVAMTWAVPNYFAVGWHQSSAPPGQPGNTVLNGHEYIHGGVFQELEELQEDDEIIVYYEGTAHHYRVSEQHILREEGQPLAVRVENAKWILPTSDERLTIVTCAPHKKSTHRLIVVALPVDDFLSLP